MRNRRGALRARVRAGRAWERLVEWFNAREFEENSILLGFSLAIGLLGAAGVVAFYKLIDLAFWLFFQLPAGALERSDLLLYRPLFTAAGLALAWTIVQRLGHGREGPNIPTVQLAVARRDGEIPVRRALARTAASAVTLGAGGSAGSEGPVAVLGATAGSWLGRLFRSDPSRVRVLVAAGAAAGISASFNAPLAGAFFALEEILGSLAAGAFPPVVVSSVVAAMASRAVFGDHPAFPVPGEYGYELGREVVLFIPVLGVLCGLTAVLFIRTYFGTDALVRRLPLPRAAIPWLGGAVVGTLVWLSGGTLVGYGHLAVRLELFGRVAGTTLLLLALGKIVATSVTLAMGGSGGVFTPSLYVGATVGGAFGVLLSRLFPGLGLHPEMYALVGMGAVVAVATEAPITAILMVFEMTNDYEIVLPLMLATVISSLVARRLEPDSLYSGWLRRRGEAIAHGADRDLLALLRVEDALDPNPQVIGERATVAELLDHLDRAAQTEFPVIDAQRRFTGIITVADLGRIARNAPELSSLVVAADLAQESESIAPSASLLEAIRKMGVRGGSVLPVVEPRDGRLVGLVSRSNILSLYERSSASSPSHPPRPGGGERRRGERRRGDRRGR